MLNDVVPGRRCAASPSESDLVVEARGIDGVGGVYGDVILPIDTVRLTQCPVMMIVLVKPLTLTLPSWRAVVL